MLKIGRLYRFIFISSLVILSVGVLSLVLGGLFFNFYSAYPSLERVAGIIIMITPFAPAGTLFGTLKEDQSTRKKMAIIAGTGLSVLFLMVLIWGTLVALAFSD